MAFINSAVSKVVAGVATLQNETTFALTSLNLGFTLIRLDAPKEFSGVGTTISERRKENAESGKLHRTARKLGALFDEILPQTPHLFRAYGKRVSEICEKEDVNPQGTTRHGMFSRHIGADAASIWAAVTSGDGAISVHLLACMLARMFTGPQATSLWMSLIANRKEQIEKQVSEATDMSKCIAMACATQQEITREEIANWDNSARSWIQSADLAKSKEQNKAMFITDSAGLIVNNEADVYNSVVRAWADAMVAMNNLVVGIPQKIQSGALLLGMTSWHLYPDLVVLSHGQEPIRQNDPLIGEAGVLTVGLEAKHDFQGSLSWSLPLSYMRYYGSPVSTSQKLSIDSTRVSMDQFGFILLGCVFSTWDQFARTRGDGMKWALKILAALRWPEEAETQDPSNMERMRKITSRSSWIGQLLSAAEQYEAGDEIEQGIAMKLIGLGQRQKEFLCDAKAHPPPLFGLCEMSVLFSLLDNSEARIKYLRRFAQELGLLNSNCVIRYKYVEGGVEVWEYATIRPIQESLGKEADSGYVRRRGLREIEIGKHVRWIPIATKREQPCKCKGPCVRPSAEEGATRSKFTIKKSAKPGCPCWEQGGCSITCHDWKRTSLSSCGALHCGLSSRRMRAISAVGELCLPVHLVESEADPRHRSLDFGYGSDFQASLNELSKDRKDSKSFVQLQFCAGAHRSAEILKIGGMTETGEDKRRVRPGDGSKQIGEFITAKSMEHDFDPKDFDYRSLTEWFASKLRSRGYKEYLTPLRACASAAEVYKRLPHATIDTSILKHSLQMSKWIPKFLPADGSPLRLVLSRPQVFACIAMFESGSYNLDPEGLKEVFAISSGNSIFVASSILCDPYEEPTCAEVQRVPGNIGRAGLSLLIPPADPKIHTPSINNWQQLNYKPFTGKLEDNFPQTSIHLSFTEYELPLQSLNNDGHIIDRPVRLVETLAQVYDRTKWIADLDIIRGLEDTRLTRVTCSIRKGTSELPCSTAYSKVFDGEYNMVSVDNWDELLTPDEGSQSVVRAKDNWLARLATAAVCAQLRKHPVLLPADVCWACLKMQLEKMEDLNDSILII